MGNFALDYAKYLWFPFVSTLIILIMDETTMIDDGNLEFFIVLSLLLGLPLITWSYLLAYRFKKFVTAFTSMFLLGLMTGFILPLTLFILTRFETTKSYAEFFTGLCRLLFPSFCFGNSLFNMALRDYYSF